MPTTPLQTVFISAQVVQGAGGYATEPPSFELRETYLRCQSGAKIRHSISDSTRTCRRGSLRRARPARGESRGIEEGALSGVEKGRGLSSSSSSESMRVRTAEVAGVRGNAGGEREGE